jgi:hypothetical protein
VEQDDRCARAEGGPVDLGAVHPGEAVRFGRRHGAGHGGRLPAFDGCSSKTEREQQHGLTLTPISLAPRQRAPAGRGSGRGAGVAQGTPQLRYFKMRVFAAVVSPFGGMFPELMRELMLLFDATTVLFVENSPVWWWHDAQFVAKNDCP